MFEIGLIESARKRPPKTKLLTFPVAFAIHVLVLVLIVVAQLWAVETVPEPTLAVSLWAGGLGVPLGNGGTTPPPAHRNNVRRIRRDAVVPPAAVHDVVARDAPTSPADEPPQLPPGVPGGIGDETGGGGGGGGGADDTTDRAADVDPAPVIVSAEIEAPRLLHKVEPVFPEIARIARREGVVIVEAVIDKEGNVTDARVMADRAGLGCGAAALDAVRQWKYRPATFRDSGRPVSVYLYVTVSFRIQ